MARQDSQRRRAGHRQAGGTAGAEQRQTVADRGQQRAALAILQLLRLADDPRRQTSQRARQLRTAHPVDRAIQIVKLIIAGRAKRIERVGEGDRGRILAVEDGHQAARAEQGGDAVGAIGKLGPEHPLEGVGGAERTHHPAGGSGDDIGFTMARRRGIGDLVEHDCGAGTGGTGKRQDPRVLGIADDLQLIGRAATDIDEQGRGRGQDDVALDGQGADLVAAAGRHRATDHRQEGRIKGAAARQQAADDQCFIGLQLAIDIGPARQLVIFGPHLEIAGRGDVEPGRAVDRQFVDRGIASERGLARFAQGDVIVTRLDVVGGNGAVDRLDIVGDEVERPRAAGGDHRSAIAGRGGAAGDVGAILAIEAGLAIASDIAVTPTLQCVGHRIDQLAVGTDHDIIGIHVLNPVGGVEPVAIASQGRDIFVRVVLDDIFPEIEQRRVDVHLTVGRNAAIIADAAGQHAGDDRTVPALVDDQRTARIAACGRAF